MRVTIVNISQSIHATEFHAAVASIGKQVSEDFEPAWSISAIVRGVTHDITSKAPIEGLNDALIYLGDASQDPTTGVEGALGYHSTNHKDIPYGFVYLDICAEYGEEWTTTLSHEVLELLGDPSAVVTVTGPDPRKANRNVQFDLEVCDPTQGDSYLIDDVRVSNFVTPTYFGKPGGPRETNFLKLPLKPFGVRPRGYFQYEDSRGAHQVNGKQAEAMLARRTAARKLMGLGRRNTRRAARLRGKRVA
jgi:hypothetical protein